MQTHVVWLKTGVLCKREKAKRSVWSACELCDVRGLLALGTLEREWVACLVRDFGLLRIRSCVKKCCSGQGFGKQ